ncbi:MAG: FMN-binding protein [Pseudomonadota bacterium]|nr:FMN-binding protein [Pseudomonadota bacterium]
MIKRGLLLLSLLLAIAPAVAEEYLSDEAFYAQAFGNRAGQENKSALWLKAGQKAVAEQIFGHPWQGLRIRYRQLGATTAWILDETGKEKPIRIGVIIDADRIRQVSVLAFNESRGWEVRYPFFTAQFTAAALDDDLQLTTPVDGITGATLSVRAVTGVSRWALYLNSLVNQHLQTASDQASLPASSAD